jgi:uncharacterized membrane protein YgcG
VVAIDGHNRAVTARRPRRNTATNERLDRYRCPVLREGTVATTRIRIGLAAAVLAILAIAAPALAVDAPAAGPPFPEPETDRTVYDYADVFAADTEAQVTATIASIEGRTGAEIVVLSQVKPSVDTPEEAEADAIALMDQWGVGRRGFDDGLVILFDLDETLEHGQVQLYAGPGYAATFLSNSERQRVFEDTMLPLLEDADLDGALLAAMREVDAAATPEHAARLERARQLDAVLGLFIAPLGFLALTGAAVYRWFRYGRDPDYGDSPSILMPAPPPDLTAAGGSVLMDGKAGRRTLTTAMLDLASRGALSFREDEKGAAKVGIQLLDASQNQDPYVVRARRRPIGKGEEHLLTQLHTLGAGPYVEPDELSKLSSGVSTFNSHVETSLVERGWFRAAPSSEIARWTVIGIAEIVLGIVVALPIAQNIPSGGLAIIGGAIAAAGVVTVIFAQAMPARTKEGAILVAMLKAYRRTLQKTLAQARSMTEVVESRSLPWLETPDQAVVWGVALGLHDDVQRVLDRSVEDMQAGRTTSTGTWLPAWYGSTSSSGASGPGGLAPGLMSSGGIPNLGGMIAAVGTIGAATSTSSSGGSGGFSGGSSGGGGGGSGGGF